MPFRSEKQRRFMWAEHPEIARRWSEKYKNKKNLPMYVNPEKNDKNGSKKEAQLETKPHKLKSAKKPHNILPFFVTSEKNATVLPLSSVKSNTLFTPADTFSGKWKRKDIEASMSDCDEKIAVNALLNKIAAVINPNLLRALEERKALAEARKARYIPNNVNLKQYPAAMQGPAIPPPMGMSAPPPQPPQQQSPTPPQNAVGGGNHPSANPINTFGGLSMSGDLNGNAAFGAKNSPDSSKIAAAITKWAAATPCSCGCGDTVATCKCGKDCKCRKPGGSCYKTEKSAFVGMRMPKEMVFRVPDRVAVNFGSRKGSLVGGIAGLAGGGLYGATAPGEYIGEDGKKKKRSRLMGALRGALGYGAGGYFGGALAGGLTAYGINKARGNKIVLKRAEAEKSAFFGQSPEQIREREYQQRLYAMYKKLQSQKGGELTEQDMAPLYEETMRHMAAEKKAAKKILSILPSSGGQKWQLGEWGLNPQAGYRYLGGVLPTPDLALRFGTPVGGMAVGLDPLPYIEADRGRPSGRFANKDGRSFYKWLGDKAKNQQTALTNSLAKVPENSTPDDYEAVLRSHGVGYSSKELKRMAQQLARKPNWVPTVQEEEHEDDKPQKKKADAHVFGRALAIKFAAKSPAWQREAGKNEEGGLNAKGRASYNKATGGNLKAPVTQKNPKGKAKSRRASFCARMGGMKKKLTGEKTKNDPDSRINKALRKWNC